MEKLIELSRELVMPDVWPATVTVIGIICLAVLGYLEVRKGQHLNQ